MAKNIHFVIWAALTDSLAYKCGGKARMRNGEHCLSCHMQTNGPHGQKKICFGKSKEVAWESYKRHLWLADIDYLSAFFLSGLPQQREHCEQRLEDPQHSEEQVVRLHGEDAGGEAGVAGGYFKRERKTKKWVVMWWYLLKTHGSLIRLIKCT